jgi:hypothetical protein
LKTCGGSILTPRERYETKEVSWKDKALCLNPPSCTRISSDNEDKKIMLEKVSRKILIGEEEWKKK